MPLPFVSTLPLALSPVLVGDICANATVATVAAATTRVISNFRIWLLLIGLAAQRQRANQPQIGEHIPDRGTLNFLRWIGHSKVQQRPGCFGSWRYAPVRRNAAIGPELKAKRTENRWLHAVAIGSSPGPAD